MKSYFTEYRLLRDQIDAECSRLEDFHKDHLVCAPGCTGCCMNFRVFPVEFYSIRKEIEGRDIIINDSALPEQCVFLVNGLCSVYASRPVICRTHGLPLMAMGEDNWELSHCQLNFTIEPPEFDDSNTFASDRFNSSLFMLNKEFISSFREKSYNEFSLVDLRDLGMPEGEK